VKNGVAAELSKLTAFDPSWTHAVVFGTDDWQPVMPPEGEQWDYDPFTRRDQAEEAMRFPQSPRFAGPELWERRDGGWEQAAIPGSPTLKP
jgi:hypothetical protein